MKEAYELVFVLKCGIRIFEFNIFWMEDLKRFNYDITRNQRLFKSRTHETIIKLEGIKQI